MMHPFYVAIGNHSTKARSSKIVHSFRNIILTGPASWIALIQALEEISSSHSWGKRGQNTFFKHLYVVSV